MNRSPKRDRFILWTQALLNTFPMLGKSEYKQSSWPNITPALYLLQKRWPNMNGFFRALPNVFSLGLRNNLTIA